MERQTAENKQASVAKVAPKIKITSIYKFRQKSQYVGEHQYQIESLVDGEKEVGIENAVSVREAKMKFKSRIEERVIRQSGGAK